MCCARLVVSHGAGRMERFASFVGELTRNNVADTCSNSFILSFNDIGFSSAMMEEICTNSLESKQSIYQLMFKLSFSVASVIPSTGSVALCLGISQQRHASAQIMHASSPANSVQDKPETRASAFVLLSCVLFAKWAAGFHPLTNRGSCMVSACVRKS